MPDPITRIIFRRGTELERGGLILNQGEPGFTIDTKRLFVGDGVTLGGIPIGTKFLGFFTFGAEFTNIPQNTYPQLNDLAFDTTTNIMYALTGNADGSVTSSRKDNWSPVGVNIQADNTTISRTIDTIAVKRNSLDGNYFTATAIGLGLERTGGTYNKDTIRISAPGQGLIFNGNSLQINNASVTNAMLATMGPYTVKGRLETAGEPVDIGFAQLSNLLAPLLKPIINPPFNPGVSPPRYSFTNGIYINDMIDPPLFSVDTNYIDFNLETIHFKKTVTCFGDIIAFYTPSDISIKSNLMKITEPLNKIQQLNGYSFVFNEKAPQHLRGKNSYGLIAQEVEQVLSDSIEDRPDGIKGVNYNAIIPLLVECIKNLQNDVADLKNKLSK